MALEKNRIGRVEGKVAVVTGANGGLGSAIAMSLGNEGAKVALGVRRGRDIAEKVAKEINNKGSIVAGPTINDIGIKKIIIVKILYLNSKLLKFDLKSEKNIEF